MISPAEIAFRLHGLEAGAGAGSRIVQRRFTAARKLCSEWGAGERVLEGRNRGSFVRSLHKRPGEVWTAKGPRDHPLWRRYPEPWLESLVIREVDSLDWNGWMPNELYSQVPAFSAADRAMIDVLAVTRAGTSAVVELKADEDILLFAAAGDRLFGASRYYHSRGAFKTFGKNEGRGGSSEKPLLVLVAPALRRAPGDGMSSFVMFQRRLNGNSWGSMSGGEKVCGLYSGRGRV